jgi:hypothetical protein
MKKIFLSLSIVFGSFAVASAQDHSGHDHAAEAAVPAAKATSLTADNMVFKEDSHDFGTVDEGAPAEYAFQVKNTGKEPLVIQRVQPSCGCTTPDWTKDPIAPGKTGLVKASYGTQGRPGHFDKTLTVVSNAGTKVLTIKGDVTKAPETSVPQNNSMMRTN